MGRVGWPGGGDADVSVGGLACLGACAHARMGVRAACACKQENLMLRQKVADIK